MHLYIEIYPWCGGKSLGLVDLWPWVQTSLVVNSNKSKLLVDYPKRPKILSTIEKFDYYYFFIYLF